MISKDHCGLLEAPKMWRSNSVNDMNLNVEPSFLACLPLPLPPRTHRWSGDSPKNLSALSRSVADLFVVPRVVDAGSGLNLVNLGGAVRAAAEETCGPSISPSPEVDAFEGTSSLHRGGSEGQLGEASHIPAGKRSRSLEKGVCPTKAPCGANCASASFATQEDSTFLSSFHDDSFNVDSEYESITNEQTDKEPSCEASTEWLPGCSTQKPIVPEIVTPGAEDFPASHEESSSTVASVDFPMLSDLSSPEPMRHDAFHEETVAQSEPVHNDFDRLVRSTFSSHPLDESGDPVFRILDRGSPVEELSRSGAGSPRSTSEEAEATHELVSFSDVQPLEYEDEKIDFVEALVIGGANARSELSIAVSSSNEGAAVGNDDNGLFVDARDAPQVANHRRWLSDTTQGPSHFRRHLEEQLEREQELTEESVVLRRSEGRNGVLPNRCRSQLIIGKEEITEELEEPNYTELHRSLSTSTPSVNDATAPTLPDQLHEESRSHPVVEVAQQSEINDFKRNYSVDRKETQKWSHLMLPSPHQVISPVQRPARLGSSSNAVGDSTEKPGNKVEKNKSRRASGLLDNIFPSYRKRKGDVRGLPGSPHHAIDRRSTIADGPNSSMGELPDVLAYAISERPSTIGVSDGRFLSNHIREERNEFVPLITKPKWSDLDLWTDEPACWSLLNSHEKLSKQERKRQDVIYELYITEKHYCQVLVILQQVYQEGLRVCGILPESKRNELIPTVLDALLDFHINLLRKLRAKRSESAVVDAVSEIMYTEFEKGERSQAAVHAYTEICSKKDRCGRLYDDWRGKNPEFLKFFDEFEKDPKYKERTFKMCLLLIAQRLTKYPVLLDQLNKLEVSSRKEASLRALVAAKSFASRVDTELAKMELNRRWDRIRNQMDRNSVGRLNHSETFTYDDLVVSPDLRKVMCIGGAQCHSTQQKAEEGTDVILILFDDVLVILAAPMGKNEKYTFCDRGPTGCSVIALKTLMVRDMPRNTSVFLVVDLKPCFDLFVVTFTSKSDLAQWKRAIEAAKEAAPLYVRRALPTSSDPILLPKDEDPEEARFVAEMDEWEKQLRVIFDVRKSEENDLAVFIEKRFKWFGILNDHIQKIPVKNRLDGQKLLIPDKIKALVKDKFAELRFARRSSLRKVLDYAERVCEDDFVSFFNDAHDASAGTSDSSHSSDHSESDESRSRRPRRNRTFHGTDEKYKDSSIRRHTTEPKLAERRLTEGETELAVGDDIHKLPLGLSSRARRAASRIIKENVQIRIENSQLRGEVALQELHLASLKTRRLAATPASALEALRKKQQDLQNQEISFRSSYEAQAASITERERELKEKEKELKAREEQLQEQWKKYAEMNSAESVSHHRPLCSTRPTLAGNSFRSPSSIHERQSPFASRAAPGAPLNKSVSSSSMPLHLAEKTAKIRTKKA